MTTNQVPYWPGWETVRLIGRGSFGAVYEIQRKLFEDGDEVEKAALKVISIPQNESEIEEMYSDGYDEESVTSTFRTYLKSIIVEYSLMRKMNGSANIVNGDDIRYVQHDDGIGWDIFIKMELLTPLTKALPAEITEETVVNIARDMCAALELCKKHEIVHRDIKPHNIFVSPNGDYKLGDFGIAKTVEKTMGGTKIGTYKYMAPEVYNNQPYGTAADIYSLGLVLYWLLNERRMPFLPLPPEKITATMEEEARRRRLSGERLPTPAHGSKNLKKIVLKACAFDPKDRYQTAREMREDLARLSGGRYEAPRLESDLISASDEEQTDGRTVGPVFDDVVDNDWDGGTVGPDFGKHKKQMHPEEEQDSATVGPVFYEKKEATGRKKSRKLLLIAITALIAVLAVLPLVFPNQVPAQKNDLLNEQVQVEEEILISHETISFNRVGDKIILTSNQNNPSWSTNNPSVASVNSEGVVTIIGSGEAEIYAEWNGKVDTCYITVECLYPADLKTEMEEAESLLATVDRYQEQYATYSYNQLDDIYCEFIEGGGYIEPHSYPGVLIREDPHVNIWCYDAEWYYVLKVDYFDYLGQKIYEDRYNVIVDQSQYDSTKPTYFNWTTADTHGYYYTVTYKADTYHRYYNLDSSVTVRSMYGANYVADGVTRNITVWAENVELSNPEKYIVKVVAGEVNNAALYSDGTVKSSGLDYHGEGNVEDWRDIIDVYATECLTVGLKRDGSVIVAGRNTDSQCNVSDWTDISAIAASGYNVIGVKRDGTVEAVGNNDYGQCNVDSWTGIVQADIGTTHAVGLRADGTVVATGDNEYGQCNVSEWTDIVSIKVAYVRTIGLKADGTVVATGGNFDGECDVSSWTDIVAIDTDGNHTVGLRADGTVVAAGFNSWESYDACDVGEWTDIIYVEVGYYRTIGLKSDGTIVVTGWNDRGQCDIGELSLQ